MDHIHKNCPTNPYVQSFKQNHSNAGKHSMKAAEYVCDVLVVACLLNIFLFVFVNLCHLEMEQFVML